MSVIPVIEGFTATLVAAVLVAGWMAIGSMLVGESGQATPMRAPAALLIGNALVTFALALFCAGGLVRTGAAVTFLAGFAAIVVRRRALAAMLRAIGEPLARLVHDPLGLCATIVFGVSLWATAIAPPRNADAMRYHLAHIRQIVSDGRWARIADVHYALPFGWSLSYLPFELLHLPQGSQLLSVALLVVFMSSLLRLTAPYDRGSMLAGALVLLHPAILRAFSEPTADAYAIFVMLAILLALLGLCDASARDAAVAGFAVWIGAQSRYQLIGAAIVGSACALAILWRLREQRRLIIPFAGGAAVALVLASPFYIANALWFSDPVWPLLIDARLAALSYANMVAYTFRLPLEGTLTLSSVEFGLARLVTTPFLFPLPFVTAAALLTGVFMRRGGSRIAGWFGITFLVLWTLVQPLLFPRFILLVIPAASFCITIAASMLVSRSSNSRTVAWRLSLVLAGLLALAAPALAYDDLRYAVTGNAEGFHRFTWFYDTYQWINRETPPDARILVIVTSGMTYYLNRQYRRADPWLSGEVDWAKTSTGAALDKVLDRGGYRYILYEDLPEWTYFPGGAEMRRAISEARASGDLVEVRAFDETLYSSRERRQVLRKTRVYMLERVGADRGSSPKR